MPVVSQAFDVQGNIDSVWRLFNDPLSLGKLIPGCEEASIIGPNKAKWKVKVSVGMISKRFETISQVVESEAPRKMKLKLNSVEGDLTGELLVELAPKGDSQTHVSFTAKVDVRGPFQWMVDQIIKTQLTKMVSEFAEEVSKLISH